MTTNVWLKQVRTSPRLCGPASPGCDICFLFTHTAIWKFSRNHAGFLRAGLRNAREGSALTSAVSTGEQPCYCVGMYLPVALFLRGGTAWGSGDTGQMMTDDDSRL